MENLKKTLLEKHAGWLKNTFKNLPWVKRYNAIKSTPMFKTQKAIGTVGLASLPVLYAGHKLSQTPEPITSNQLQRNTIEGIPPSQQ